MPTPFEFGAASADRRPVAGRLLTIGQLRWRVWKQDRKLGSGTRVGLGGISLHVSAVIFFLVPHAVALLASRPRDLLR